MLFVATVLRTLVTVSVYVVVVVGERVTGVPLVTEIFPGVMTPVPPEKYEVNVVLLPGAIDERPRTNSFAAGSSYSVTTMSGLAVYEYVPLSSLVTITLYVPPTLGE